MKLAKHVQIALHFGIVARRCLLHGMLEACHFYMDCQDAFTNPLSAHFKEETYFHADELIADGYSLVSMADTVQVQAQGALESLVSLTEKKFGAVNRRLGPAPKVRSAITLGPSGAADERAFVDMLKARGNTKGGTS